MGTKSFASLIKNRFEDSGKKYRAIVKKPINKQKPLAKRVNENTNEFQFSDKTFDLEGKGRIQYAATLQDNSPLPNWIRFLPSQRTFLIDTKTKGNIEEINLTVSAKNINAVTEDNFTLVVDPELRSQRLAKEKRIKEEKKLAEKRKKQEEKRLKAQKLKEEKERKKAEAKKLKAEKKALDTKTFDLAAKVTDKDGNIFSTLDADEKAKLIKAQEKKNKKLRKKLLKAKKKAEKKKKKLASKNIKKEAKTKKVEEAVELNIADITEKTIYSDAPEELANVYIRSLEKDGGIYKLYSDEEIQKFIKKQEKKNVKLRKRLEKIKKKEAKQKAKKLKISKLN